MHIPYTFAVDVAKSLIGSFIGAGLAFALALWRDHILRLRDRRAAGNLAIATIARQYSDFLQVRTSINEHRQMVLQANPNVSVPPWMQMKPMHFLSSDNLKFNLESLTFLFEYKSATILERLINAELQYHDLAKLIHIHSETAEQMQQKLAAAGAPLNGEASIANLETVVGTALVAKLNSFVPAIFIHLERDEQKYLDAVSELRSLLVKIFGPKGIADVQKAAPQPAQGAKPLSPS